MKNTTVLYCVITVSVIAVLGLAWKCWLQSQTIDAYSQILSMEKDFIEIRDQVRDLQYRELLTLQSVGYDISETNIRREDNPSRVYLRIHERICAGCYVNSIIDIYTALSDTNPISIVGSYQYQSSFADLLRDCKITDAATMNDMSILNLIPADSADIPYIFTLDNSSAINNLLFLDKSFMDSEKINAYREMLN